MRLFRLGFSKVSPEKLFMISSLLVNGGNYLYNLVLGRMLGPEAFADAALLITLLLVLSFVGMTFQLVTAKFAVLFSKDDYGHFQNTLYSYALGLGILLGLLVIVFSSQLQAVFKTHNSWMFITFGIGIPLYFVMSINRGKFQGFQNFKQLAVTYQTEMWSRFLITILLLLLLPLDSSFLVALGIGISFVFGLIPSNLKGITLFSKNKLSKQQTTKIVRFIGLTGAYELTQILINNSDILLVKHYFNPLDAGLYASLALIGRVVYFIAWMYVMLLLPTVVQKHKDGEATAPVLSKYVSYISLLSSSIVVACYLFPDLIITLLFGEAYLAMSSLLWQYALATSLFAISNIFAYYFLSLDQYKPVLFSGILGVAQIILIICFHSSLAMVVQIQIIGMVSLLIAQLIYFFKQMLK